MTKTFAALVAAATLVTTTAADARCPGCVGEPPPYAPPGYVYYPAYGGTATRAELLLVSPAGLRR
jgi:hypothetical protein